MLRMLGWPWAIRNVSNVLIVSSLIIIILNVRYITSVFLDEKNEN